MSWHARDTQDPNDLVSAIKAQTGAEIVVHAEVHVMLVIHPDHGPMLMVNYGCHPDPDEIPKDLLELPIFGPLVNTLFAAANRGYEAAKARVEEHYGAPDSTSDVQGSAAEAVRAAYGDLDL